MDSDKRRASILMVIQKNVEPVTGADLAKRFQVSRQAIVQDIALLRAAGHEIFATPQGYILPQSLHSRQHQRIFAMKHTPQEIYDELMSIVDLGGKIINVIVEHPIYGEFKGQLMLASPSDVRDYLDRMSQEGAEPLSSLTEGVHLHTIEADKVETIDRIEQVLREKGYLLEED